MSCRRTQVPMTFTYYGLRNSYNVLSLQNTGFAAQGEQSCASNTDNHLEHLMITMSKIQIWFNSCKSFRWKQRLYSRFGVFFRFYPCANLWKLPLTYWSHFIENAGVIFKPLSTTNVIPFRYNEKDGCLSQFSRPALLMDRPVILTNWSSVNISFNWCVKIWPVILYSVFHY